VLTLLDATVAPFAGPDGRSRPAGLAPESGISDSRILTPECSLSLQYPAPQHLTPDTWHLTRALRVRHFALTPWYNYTVVKCKGPWGGPILCRGAVFK
jgi:hypothetical protein